jgi:hypothetical protein
MKASIKKSQAYQKAKSIYSALATELHGLLNSLIANTKKLSNLIASRLGKKQPGDTAKLYPLYPNVEPSEHRIYTKALNDALRDKEIHNIALTGGYGSGKSSVLKDFTLDKQKRTVFISFSTLGADITRYTIQDPAKEKDKENGLDSVANLIQKEIVKHILYREKYARIPASRYPKIHRARFPHVLTWSLALTLAFPPATYATGLLHFQTINNLKSAIFMGLFFIGACYALQALIPLIKKLQPNAISGGPVSIALSTSTNYFDQYLDEIIYFFEATKYDIVVLEDIDRFHNLYIFENLRQLNTLLNNSRQINKNIRFIYAVKDSIFHADEDENGQKDISNRTKFFDLIIPTVPFITHKNSRDVMLGMFGKYGITRSAVGVVSKHVTDMRLVKNIYNEFVIFYEKIFGEGKIQKLSVDSLFALIVYKNIEVQDFEQIKLGTSRLDTIFQKSRDFIKKQLNENNAEIASIRQKLRAIDSIGRRSNDLGMKLVAHVQDILDDNNGVLLSYEFNSKQYARNNELKTEGLWLDICNADTGATFRITYQRRVPRRQYNNGEDLVAAISIDDIKRIVGDDLDISRWNANDAEPLQARLKTLENENSAIRTKAIKQLIDDYPNFKAQVADVAKCELLADLFTEGQIDSNYALYTSIYREESVSAQGMNYIVQNLQANKQDIYYAFDNDEDIKNMLSDLDDVYFNSKSIYNFDIVNFLLRTHDKRLDFILKNLMNGTGNDLAFLDKFFENNNEAVALIARIVQAWPATFDYLVNCTVISEETRSELLHIAVVNSNNDLNYETSEEIRQYLANQAHTVSCIAESFSDEATNKTRRLLKLFGAKIASLDKISNSGVLSFVEENDLYEINATNLSKLIDDQSLALDNIKAKSPHAFKYICSHLGDYMSALEDNESTPNSVEDGDEFVGILHSISAQEPTTIDALVAKVSNNCLVEDITSADKTTWDALFSHIRVSNSIHNVLSYFIENGQQLSDKLGDYLNTSQNIVGICDEDDHKAPKTALGIAILNSQTMSQERKLVLMNDLGLKEYLDAADIQADGDIFGRLLSDDIIEDTATSFNELANKSWHARESYIANSSDFLEYINDVALKTDDLSQAFASPTIPTPIKNYLLDNILTYKDVLSDEGKRNAANYALEGQVNLNADTLLIMLNPLSLAQQLGLIVASRDKLSRDNALALMPLLGGEYAKLVQPSKRPFLQSNDLNRALLDWLQSLDIVNTINDDKGGLRANVKSHL